MCFHPQVPHGRMSHTAIERLQHRLVLSWYLPIPPHYLWHNPWFFLCLWNLKWPSSYQKPCRVCPLRQVASQRSPHSSGCPWYHLPPWWIIIDAGCSHGTTAQRFLQRIMVASMFFLLRFESIMYTMHITYTSWYFVHYTMRVLSQYPFESFWSSKTLYCK